MSGFRLTRWSCHKLECLAEYFDIYALDLKNGGCYLELFGGPGQYECKEADCRVDGIELRVLKVKEGFSRYIFVTQDTNTSQSLTELFKPLDNMQAINLIVGNTTRETTMRQIFDLIPRSTASFALIDPPGFAYLRWSLIKKLASHGADWKGRKMDLLIIFPLEMAVLRNLARKECERSLNRFYGNDDWQAIRLKQAEGHTGAEKLRRELLELFKDGLKRLGYSHVEDTLPARFTNPPYYHVIWASDRTSRVKELRSVWSRDRYLPCEMFHEGLTH
jgi:three-Cys-motif partner protein